MNYEKTPDVSPSYYRIGDVNSGSAPVMLSGVEERAKGLAPSGVTATPSSPSGGAAPKFCPECGAGNAGGKFCGECGFKW